MERTRFFVKDIPTSALGFKDGEVIHFLYMEIDGELVEITRTADCPWHIAMKDDKTRHFCVGDDEHAYPLHEQKCTWICGEVCQHRKRIIREEIEKHGEYFDAKTLKCLNEYIAKADTFKRYEQE